MIPRVLEEEGGILLSGTITRPKKAPVVVKEPVLIGFDTEYRPVDGARRGARDAPGGVMAFGKTFSYSAASCGTGAARREPHGPTREQDRGLDGATVAAEAPKRTLCLCLGCGAIIREPERCLCPVT